MYLSEKANKKFLKLFTLLLLSGVHVFILIFFTDLYKKGTGTTIPSSYSLLFTLPIYGYFSYKVISKIDMYLDK